MINRLSRVNELLKREIGKILLKEAIFENIFVTITRVESSSNLNEAKIFISVMPENRTDEVFRFLNKEIYHIQKMLNKRLKMRPIPKIKFKEEEKTKIAGRIEEILENLKKGKK